MDYRILIIKNRYTKKLKFKFDWANIVADEISTDYDLTFDNISNGTYTGVIPSIQNYPKFIVPRFKYHAVVLIYGNKVNGIRLSSCNATPLYPETEFVTLANTKNSTIKHELIHSFFKRLARQGINLKDDLDTYASGVEDRALELLQPYWESVCKMQVLNTPYKYFKDSEVVGLKPELVRLLDKMRGECGFPFIINSGYRTDEHNEEVGGVDGSAHTKGLAVDIKCITSEQRFKIIRSAISNGITRIGVAKTYAHLDIDQTKPQGVVWLYA